MDVYPGNFPAMNPIKLNCHNSLYPPKSESRKWQDDVAVNSVKCTKEEDDGTVVPERWWGGEIPGFPEGAVPCRGEDVEGPRFVEEAWPCVGGVSPTIGLPAPNRTLGEPISTEGPRRGLIETGGVEGCAQGLEEDDGGAAGGVHWISLFRFFMRTLASQLEITTSARVIVVHGGTEGGEMDRDGPEEWCPHGETLWLKVHWAFDEEGCVL